MGAFLLNGFDFPPLFRLEFLTGPVITEYLFIIDYFVAKFLPPSQECIQLVVVVISKELELLETVFSITIFPSSTETVPT